MVTHAVVSKTNIERMKENYARGLFGKRDDWDADADRRDTDVETGVDG